MRLINSEQLMPIILEGIRWVRERGGPSKKDLELQMSELRKQVRFLLVTRGENLGYQNYVIRQILERVQTSGDLVINANTININIHYESPKCMHVAGPSILDNQEPQIIFFERQQEEGLNYEDPKHTHTAVPSILDKREPWVVPFEEGQEENLISVSSCAKARVDVVYRHIEVLLCCSRITKSDFKTLYEATKREELYAAGVYLEDNDRRIAEVEIAVDWDKYRRAIAIEGAYFNTNLPDWHRSVSPLIYKITNSLLSMAVTMGKPIYAWFSTLKRPTRGVGKDEKTVYYFEKKVPPWATAPSENSTCNSKLREITVTYRH